MYINFETTGHHSIRFNPNLYNDGKVRNALHRFHVTGIFITHVQMSHRWISSLVTSFYFDMLKMGLNFLREFCNLATVLGNNAARVFD